MKTLFAGGTIDLEETKGEEDVPYSVMTPKKPMGVELSLAEEAPKGKDKRRAAAKSAEPKGRG